MARTALILADQLGVSNPALADADRVIFVESMAALKGRRYHRARVQLVLSAMRHRAAELRDDGLEVVEIRAADSIEAAVTGLEGVACIEPESRTLADVLRRAGVELLPSHSFLAGSSEFAAWAEGRKRITMEPFYRSMRRRLGVLLDPDGGPEGGRWNLDAENRRPPKEGLSAPQPWLPQEDAIDAEVRRDIRSFEQAGLRFWGDEGPRRFAATAAEAHIAMDDFIENRLDGFGPWQDAMVPGERTLFHSNLAVPLNLGLLEPIEPVRLAESAFREGRVPLQSAEGFIRQIIGWREFVRGVYRLRAAEWEFDNGLDARLPLPAAFYDPAAIDWECLRQTLTAVAETGYAHHIERLMVLGNSLLLLGVDPAVANAWFRESFVDAADWVMAPNVIGMALHADGGRMMTKPYAAGGNYMSKMSRHCKSCRYDPKQRTGPEACPLTVLYWDFLDRNRERFAANPRMSLAVRNLDRIEADVLEQIRSAAAAARNGLTG